MKLPPTPKNPPRMPIKKSDDHQIDRADVRVGDREKHRDHSERPPMQQAQQTGRHTFEQNGLADDERDGHNGVDV